MTPIKVLSITLCLLIVKGTDALWKPNFKQLKEKAKKYYKSKFHKDKTWKFLGYDTAEYPGANDEYRNMNREKWDEYYKCLRRQDSDIGEHGSAIPEAVVGFEGGSIT